MSTDIIDAPKFLDVNTKQDVGYCIPEFLKIEQVIFNIANVKGRLEPIPEGTTRPEPIALVSYGPSLNDTWEGIRNFQYVMTCSGSHKFLVERGIIPTYHIDVDPRPHKIQLIGQPQKDTEYLIASTCHPQLFEYLKDYNVKLWHIFDTAEEGMRLLPHGEWAITGGCSVGVRTLTIARFMGFTNLHIFGMDGSEGPTGKHAAFHPNQPKTSYVTTYKDVEYKTTPAMLTAAQNTFHELNMMKDVTATFYGNGLVQAMAKDYVREAIEQHTFIGFNKPELISAEYRQLNEQLHRQNILYGIGGRKHADKVLQFVKILAKQNDGIPVSVLDYGCGKGTLAKSLPFPIAEYDPGVPGRTESPRPADLVVCSDVLEHVEPDRIFYVLDDLRRCVKELGYFTIHTGPASKTLPDGRNTHLIQKDLKWWRKKLQRFFAIGQILVSGPELFIIVAPKKKAK